MSDEDGHLRVRRGAMTGRLSLAPLRSVQKESHDDMIWPSIAIERPSRCHRVVTHIVAKLTEHLFVAGTLAPTASP
jgi:hypothetical protein